MKLHLHALCATLVCHSVVSFAPQNIPAFLSIAKAGSTCGHTHSQQPLSTNRCVLLMATVKDDGETLQTLFSSHCDKDGLMTKNTLQTDISAIKELLVRFMLMFAIHFILVHSNIKSHLCPSISIRDN